MLLHFVIFPNLDQILLSLVMEERFQITNKTNHDDRLLVVFRAQNFTSNLHVILCQRLDYIVLI